MKKIVFLVLVLVLVLVGCLPTVAKRYLLTIIVDPVIGGEISGGGMYLKGTTVTLTATPTDGWSFKNWTDGEGTELPYDTRTFQYLMKAENATFTAHFEETADNYALSLAATPVNGGTVSSGGEYAEGTLVTISATPLENWEFIRWVEDSATLSTDSNYAYTMPSTDVSLTAEFQRIPNRFVLSVSATPTALAGEISGGGVYDSGATVTLCATPSQNWEFVRWIEDSATMSMLTTLDYTMPSTDVELMAEFVQNSDTYIVTITATPTALAGAVSEGGTYDGGATVTLCATPSLNWEFVRWIEDDATLSTLTRYEYTVPSTNVELLAEFSRIQEKYSLSIVASPSESGVISIGGVFEAGEQVQLNANPASGWEFVRWIVEDATLSTSQSYIYTMPSTDVVITAEFREDVAEYALTLIVSPVNSGVLTGAGTYTEGATITISATPNTNWIFEKWTDESGLLISENGTYDYLMPNEDATLIAVFTNVGTELTYEIRISDVFKFGNFYNITYEATISDLPPEVDEIRISGDGIVSATTTVESSEVFVEINSVNVDNENVLANIIGFSGEEILVDGNVKLFNPIEIEGTPTLVESTVLYNLYDVDVRLNFTEVSSLTSVSSVLGANFMGFKYQGSAVNEIPVEFNNATSTALTIGLLFDDTPTSCVLYADLNSVNTIIEF